MRRTGEVTMFLTSVVLMCFALKAAEGSAGVDGGEGPVHWSVTADDSATS